MKTFLQKICCIVTIILSTTIVVSCMQNDMKNSESIEIQGETDDYINDMASLHSLTLDCTIDLAKQYQSSKADLTTEQLSYVVTESAILNGVTKYVKQKENRTLTSTEENTLKKEVNSYWKDTSNRNLVKN